MLYIKLKNNYTFTAENVVEEVNGAFEAMIRFEGVKLLSGSITAADILNNFNEENLGIIKVCKDALCTEIVCSYSIYKYLKFFTRLINSENGPTCSITISSKKAIEPMSVITG